MPITPKARKDLPDPEATIFNAAAAAEIETRTTGYADTLVTELGAAVEAAMQPKDADLTAIAALETKPTGLSLLTAANAAAIRAISEAAAATHTHAEADVTNLVADLDRLYRSGFPSKEWPGLTTPQLAGLTSNQITTTRAIRGSRFIPWRNLKARGLSFAITVLASKADECAVGILDETCKNLVAISTAQAGLLSGSTGRKDVDFTADVELEAGKTYYPFFQYGTVGETGATFAMFSSNNGSLAQLLGTDAGLALYVNGTAANFPATGLTTPQFSQSNAPYLIVRER